MALPKYSTADHRRRVARARATVDAGQGWCHEIDCLYELEGGTRYIEPGSPVDVAHNDDDPTDTTYRGEAHARCNRSRGAWLRHHGDQDRTPRRWEL